MSLVLPREAPARVGARGVPVAQEVTVVWRSFELDPTAPRRREGSAAEHLAAKYGMTPEQVAASWERLTALATAEGLEYRLASTQGGSSFDAHRLVQARRQARPGRRDGRAALSRVLHRGPGQPVSRRCSPSWAARSDCRPTRSTTLLAGDEFTTEVRADEQRAQQLGISGVPFFAIDERYGVSGAQTVEVLTKPSPPRGTSRRRASRHRLGTVRHASFSSFGDGKCRNARGIALFAGVNGPVDSSSHFCSSRLATGRVSEGRGVGS